MTVFLCLTTRSQNFCQLQLTARSRVHRRGGLYCSLETVPTVHKHVHTDVHMHGRTHTHANRRSCWHNPLVFLEREVVLNTAWGSRIEM